MVEVVSTGMERSPETKTGGWHFANRLVSYRHKTKNAPSPTGRKDGALIVVQDTPKRDCSCWVPGRHGGIVAFVT